MPFAPLLWNLTSILQQFKMSYIYIQLVRLGVSILWHDRDDNMRQTQSHSYSNVCVIEVTNIM